MTAEKLAFQIKHDFSQLETTTKLISLLKKILLFVFYLHHSMCIVLLPPFKNILRVQDRFMCTSILV